jgi:hypothetical protein
MATQRQLERCTLKRQNVAELLGVSTSTVRRLEGRTLHPVQDRDGTWWFDPAEVERLRAAEGVRQRRAAPREGAPTARGRLAARVFAMFESGATLRQIVVRTKQEPATIRELHAEWSKPLERPRRG